MSSGSPLTRLLPFAAPALIVFVLIMGALVGVARYTSLLDPRNDTLATDEHHRDPKPCLRYPTAPPSAEIRAAAQALLAAGVTPAMVADLIGDFYARAEAREAGLHALSPVDEQLEVTARGGLFNRLVIAVKRDRLREQLARILGPGPRVSATIATLPPPQRAAVEAQWAKNPSVFMLPALIPLLDQLKTLLTEARLDVLVTRLEAQRTAGLAADLEALRTELGAEALQDAWSAEFTLERTGDVITLSSLGADRVVGGTGIDTDLTRTLTATGWTVPAAEAETLAPCTGQTELTLARAELDAALADLNGVAKQARVVPAMTNGVFTGFKVMRLKPGLFTRAGLCEGDVVQTLNGMPLGSPDRALEAYSALKGAKQVTVTLTRQGQPMTLVVKLE